LGLAGRRPFPGGNPWRYIAEAEADGEEKDLQFSMMPTILGVVFSAAYLGWLVARAIPLLPNWIGALAVASSAGYTTTLPDSRGDWLRFLGHCLVRCISVVSGTLDDVRLRDKLGLLLGHLMFFSKSLDHKYRLVSRLQYLLADLISRLTLIISRCAPIVMLIYYCCTS
jgi:hypothetical protein